MRIFHSIIFFAAFCLLIITGCSSKTSTPISLQNLNDLPGLLPKCEVNQANHQLLGSWTVEFDLESLETTVHQTRQLDAHYNVKWLLPAPIIEVTGWDALNEKISVYVTLENPTILKAYDVRLIIFTDNIGHLLVNDDNWTPLYDIPGGMDINPFKAYYNGPSRCFNEQSQIVEHLEIILPGGNPQVQFAIDASYPGNCEEVYEIYDFSQDVLYDSVGAEANVEVYVHDWQDNSEEVWISCPEVFGFIDFEFVAYGTGYFDGYMTNYTGASEGEYQAIMWATSSYSYDLYLYDVITIEVRHWQGNGWGVSRGGGGMDSSFGVDIHPSGDVIFGYNGSLDGDPKMYTYRYDTNGICLWGNTVYGTNASVIAYDLACDGFNSVYATGCYWGTVDFDPSGGQDWKGPISYPWSDELFLTKFNVDGSYNWTNVKGDLGDDRGWAVTTDTNQYIYWGGAETLNETVDPSAFYAKAQPNGSALYHLYMADVSTGSNYPTITDLIPDGNGNILATGSFAGSIDIQPGTGTVRIDSLGGTDIFMCKYDANAQLLWVRQWGGFNHDRADGIFVDSNGDIFVTGRYKDTVDFDPSFGVAEYTSQGDYDVFLSKFNNNGHFQWFRTWGGFEPDIGLGVNVTNDGDIYITGAYGGVVDFDPGPNADEHLSEGSYDIFVSKFDPYGDFLWARTWGNTGYDAGLKIVSDSEGKTYTCGTFTDSMDMDPGPKEDIHETPGNADQDAFLMKLLPNGWWE